MSGSSQSFEYVVKIISPEGIRVKGDDLTDKISQKLETESNKLGKEWMANNIVSSDRYFRRFCIQVVSYISKKYKIVCGLFMNP